MAEGTYFVRAVDEERADVETLLAGDDGAWLGADRIEWGPLSARTGFRALWDRDALHLRFDVSDPSPWHTLDERDAPLWDEEVVEIFLDLDRSGTHYAEVELNPANVICDVHMIRASPDKKNDLRWNLEGIRSRTFPRDGEWVGTLALPFSGFRSLPSAARTSLPPERGDTWGFNVYRIERPHGPSAPERDAIYAAYSPTGDPSFHVPESFQGFTFT